MLRSHSNLKTFLFALALLLCASHTASAHDAKPGLAMKKAPQGAGMPIPDGAKKLYLFLGKWEGTGTSTMGGKEHTMKMHHVNTKIADGWGVKIDEKSQTEGMGSYSATTLLGYDAGTQSYHCYTIDNKGAVRDMKGVWQGDSVLTFSYEGTMGPKKLVDTYAVTWVNEKEYHFTMNMTLDGNDFVNATGDVKKIE